MLQLYQGDRKYGYAAHSRSQDKGPIGIQAHSHSCQKNHQYHSRQDGTAGQAGFSHHMWHDGQYVTHRSKSSQSGYNFCTNRRMKPTEMKLFFTCITNPSIHVLIPPLKMRTEFFYNGFIICF